MESRSAKIADLHLHSRFTDINRANKLLSDIAALGVSDACFQALTYRGMPQNLFMLYLKLKYKGVSVRAFGGIHETDRFKKIPPEKQVRSLIDLGFDGVKLMFSPDIQKYYGRGIDDPYYDKMFSLLEEEELPVLIHIADPKEFWNKGGAYYQKGFCEKEAMHKQALNMLDKHPRLRVCFAHFMFLSDKPDEAVRILEKYPNVYFDLTPGSEMYKSFSKNIPFWRGFFEKYSGRLLFGTDCNPWKNFNEKIELLVYNTLTSSGEFSVDCYGIDKLSGLSLDTLSVSRIAYENYFAFLGKTARAVNRALLLSYLERVKAELDKDSVDEYFIGDSAIYIDLKNHPDHKMNYDFVVMAINELKN